MADQIYKVLDPSGTLREISGPAGATDEQVIAQAQKLFGPKNDVASDISNDAISQGARDNANILKDIRRVSPSMLGGKPLGKTLEEAAYNAGGKVTDVTGSPILGTAANMAVSALPVYAGGEISKIAIPAQRWMAEKLMQSALKPTSKDLATGKAQRAITTMLDKGINVSEGGVNKLRGMGEKINEDVSNAIAGSSAQIGKHSVESRLADVENTFKNQVIPQSDLSAIENVSSQFLSHPELQGKATMPVQLAQKLKQGTYQQLRDKYGQMGNAETEAQKALARGLKEEIENAVPAVKQMNLDASDIWNAMNVAERRALMAGNANPIGIGVLGGPKAAAAFGFSNNSWAKSLAARLLNSTKDAIPNATRLGIASSNLNEGDR